MWICGCPTLKSGTADRRKKDFTATAAVRIWVAAAGRERAGRKPCPLFLCLGIRGRCGALGEAVMVRNTPHQARGLGCNVFAAGGGIIFCAG